jgi:hypothetical protein
MEALNLYEISYPGYFDDFPDYSVLKTAKSAGSAKYDAFLSFSDCDPDMKFGDYVKIVKVRKLGQSTPGRNEKPFPGQGRIDNPDPGDRRQRTPIPILQQARPIRYVSMGRWQVVVDR